MAGQSLMLTLANLQKGQALTLPAHMHEFMEEVGGNITNRESTPSLGVKGKVWSVHKGGEITPVTKLSTEGDVELVQIMRAVVLGYNPRRGRSYYPGSYDPDNVAAPKCWSEDGVVPHESVPEKQADRCANCQWSAKGSKVTDNNKQTTACSQHRMLAVLPLENGKTLTDTPLRLKIAITSDFDKESLPSHGANGWFGWQQYTDRLKGAGIGHTGAVVTALQFDPLAAYPKILFALARHCTPQELMVIRDYTKGDKVDETAALLKGTWTPAGTDGQRIAAPAAAVEEDEETSGMIEEDEEVAPPVEKPPVQRAPAKAAVATPPKAAPATKAAPPKAAAAPKPVAAPKPTTAAKAAPAAPALASLDDDEGDIPEAAVPAAKGPVKSTVSGTVVSDVPDDMKELLDGWGGDDE